MHSIAAKYLYPDHSYKSIGDIDLSALYAAGIRGLLIDIDNTLIAPASKKPDSRMVGWIEAARDAGFDICLLSNASRRRVTRFSTGLGIYAVAWAGKPSRTGYLKALRLLRLEPSQACAIGDQLFTDVLGAKLSGIMALHTAPITKREEITVFFKRFAEFFVLKGYRKSIGV